MLEDFFIINLIIESPQRTFCEGSNFFGLFFNFKKTCFNDSASLPFNQAANSLKTALSSVNTCPVSWIRRLVPNRFTIRPEAAVLPLTFRKLFKFNRREAGETNEILRKKIYWNSTTSDTHFALSNAFGGWRRKFFDKNWRLNGRRDKETFAAG